MEIGTIVTWSSQSGGSTTTKTGKFLGFIERKADGHAMLPLDKMKDGLVRKMPGSRVKFQDRNYVYRRALVEVPRGGKSKLSDFYAPSANIIKEKKATGS
ncbi:hypothetical protein GZH47_33375 (plasmid) [Paenibacillus rhizovicinus]|uniref:Uncharacterized protein n=1 Tax=Paenibacillus rhizovicinus TaxID=2704463 RepID=A0A6C0PB70_9BACL|nr:hypothetical protein [Paenibacillus rhizovicinus]QHW35787.1 hypothetical protein GZH47_33375 [Paenibacillus rhizovicinus]